MTLNNDDIEAIAEAIFQKLVKFQEKFEEENRSYIVSDEFGNQSNVSEEEYYQYELDKLRKIESEYVEAEKFEKAAKVQKQINTIYSKLKNIWKNSK